VPLPNVRAHPVIRRAERSVPPARSLAAGSLTSVAPPMPDGLHGAVVVGGLTLAVPIAAIREVVPRPATLLPFPAVRDEILGAIDLRGAIVPVLDPMRLFGVPTGDGCGIVLILRDGDRVIGLAIEAIGGVLHLDAANLTMMDAGSRAVGRSSLIRAAFVHGEMRGMVLDIAALAGLEAMPLAIERPSTAMRFGGATSGVPTLLFSVGTIALGLAARVIEASVPAQTITPGPVPDDLWIGWLVHNGRRVPVIDTLRFLRLGQCERTARAAAVIVRLPSGHLVGFQIDAVNDMLRITSDAIKPLQQFAVGHSRLFRGLFGSSTPTLLLDPDAVQADPELATVGRIGDQTRAVADLDRESRTGLNAFLLVRLAERRFAIPLDQVEEIIATKDSRIGLADSDQAISGFIIHRGRGVPLVSLHHALGLIPNAVTSRFTVLASADGNQAGFMVDELCAVERSSVQRLRDTGGDTGLGRIGATISTADATYPIVDLRALVEALCTAERTG